MRTGPVIPTVIYLIAWTGGYEEPQLAIRKTWFEATNLSDEWQQQMDSEVDRLDIYTIDLQSMTII